MTSLAVGTFPGFLAAVCGSVALSTLSAGVFSVPVVFGGVPKLLALVALDGLLLGSVFFAAVPYSFKVEAMF